MDISSAVPVHEQKNYSIEAESLYAPLHDSIVSGDDDRFKAVIEYLEENWVRAFFFDPNKPAKDESVLPLVRAVLYGRSYMVALMLDYSMQSQIILPDTEDVVYCPRFDVNIIDPKTGMTPLYAAVMQNETTGTSKSRTNIALLLSHGAKKDMPCANGETPQDFVYRIVRERWAEGFRRPEDVQLLKDFGIQEKFPEFSPERLAADARQEIRQSVGQKFKMKV